MDKRDNSIYVRIPDELKRKIKRHATRNRRTLNLDLLYLLELGLHVEQFTPIELPEDEADDNET